ncbi:MAG: hypothetical protein IPM63_12155 [Acidobacteriota bacterium]|nr:MAG: hypothetical protein IPM63_12155 [Acidobacteriota bacterium]
MSDFYKKLLGFLTAWPFAWIFLFIIFIFGLIASDPGGDLGPIGGVMFLIFFLVHFLTVLLAIGLQVFYIVNVFKNEKVKKEHQIAWVLALFFGGLFAMPIYWYINIWKEAPDDYSPHRTLSPGDAFESADQSRWETRTGDPVPPEPHSWR